MKHAYQLIYKNGSISELYTDFNAAMRDAIEYSQQSEDGCALYALSTGLSLMFFNGDVGTTWIEYDKVQQWFADGDEEETPLYSDLDTAVSVIDHVLPEANCVIGDDQIESILRPYLSDEQIKQAYRMAELLQDYVACIEFFETEMQIRFSCGTYIGFIMG